MEAAVKRQKVGINLTEGPIVKTLVVFAVPIILTNLIQQLYGMVDLMVIGKFVGSIGTVGVSTGGEIADLVTPVAMGFASAGQIYIAQLVGAREEGRVKLTVGTLITFMLILSLFLTGFTIVFSNPILRAMNCPEEAMGQADAYLIITSLGFPFIFGYNAVVGIMRGMGESRKPLYFIIIAAAVNVVLDLILVVLFDLQAAGTAIATTASQLGSFLAALRYLLKHKERFGFELRLSYMKVDGPILWILIKLGIPQVVRSMFVRFSMLWVNANINAYGLVISATNSVGNKIQKFAEVFISGVDTATTAMIGQNLGARKQERAKNIVWVTLGLTMFCAMVSAGICLIFPKQIFGIFTSDEVIKEMGVEYLRIISIHFFASSFVGAFQAMIMGCGFVSFGFLIGILDGVICKIGLSLLFVNLLDLGYRGYFMGVAYSRILPGLLCFAYFMSGRWRTRKLLVEEA